MNIKITDAALNWFKNELDIEKGHALRIFVRYGGEFQLKQGFSPAFTVEPIDEAEIGFQDEKDNLQFFIDETDLWYFKDSNLVIDLNKDEEIIYYEEEN